MAWSVMLAPSSRPPLRSERNTRPSAMPSQSSQASSAALPQLGIGTERVRRPLPTRSTITQQPLRVGLREPITETHAGRLDAAEASDARGEGRIEQPIVGRLLGERADGD